jgi:hypothetical protein
MKKTIKKLVLDRETLAPLVRDELGNVAGGIMSNCSTGYCGPKTSNPVSIGTVISRPPAPPISSPISSPLSRVCPR